MQKKKNIKLLFVLLGLIIVTFITAYYNPSTNDGFDKSQFSLTNTELVDRIEIEGLEEKNILTLSGRQWKLNNEFMADLVRVNDLFGIIEKISARRKVSDIEKEKLLTASIKNSIEVHVFAQDEVLLKYKIMENEKKTITYLLNDEGEIYVGNIPGYNYHIAKLFNLNSKGWRTNYVFASNWTTLEKMEIFYPDKQGFNIFYDPSGYYVDNIQELDTAKMYDYLEQVSYLQVKEFLDSEPEVVGNNQLDIIVQDAGINTISLSFYKDKEGNQYGLIDSLEWATFKSKDVEKLMKSREWFIK